MLDVEVVDPSTVTAYANQFVLNHEGFDVAARSRVEATYVCRAPQDLQIAMFMGHMHQSGVHFRLERLPETGDVGEVMYEHDWESAYVSHPPVVKYTMDAPLAIPVGDALPPALPLGQHQRHAARVPHRDVHHRDVVLPRHRQRADLLRARERLADDALTAADAPHRSPKQGGPRHR